MTSFGQKPYEANSLTSIKYFLSGDLFQSEKYISKAIALDSNNVDYYYFRATIKLYLSDTLSAINDFGRAVSIKKSYTDSLTHAFVKQRPKRNENSNYKLSPEFAETQLGVWLYLYDKNKNTSCIKLRNVDFKSIPSYKMLVDKICK